MKYALIVHEQRREQEREQLIVNFGNYVQWLAIENLYSYMQLDESDIVRLSSEDLYTYKGEKLLLPINYMMCDADICAYTTKDHRFIFSEDIVPVFLGISIKKGYWKWTEERVEYFKKYEPIGCRDYLTWEMMTEQGIRAYLGGCLTWTFPFNKERKEGKTVYFVEAPRMLREYVPEELKKDCKFVSQEVRITKEQFYDAGYGLATTKKLLEEYNENAKMVITSRLHCASPCMALGIPVILVKEYFGYPFDLLKKFVPLYSAGDFDKINWEPPKVDLEEYKTIALECARKRLLGENAESEIKKLHEELFKVYEDGYTEEKQDMNFLFKKIGSLYGKTDTFDYALWGISDNAESIYHFMNDQYPNAKLVRVVDSFRKQEFHGIMSETPDIFTKEDNFITIVTTLNCYAAAKPFFDRIGKAESRYIGVTEGTINSLEDFRR